MFLNLDFHMGSLLKGGRTYIDFHDIQENFQSSIFCLLSSPSNLTIPTSGDTVWLSHLLTVFWIHQGKFCLCAFAHALSLAWKVLNLWLRSNWHVPFSSKPSTIVIITKKNCRYCSFLLLCLECQLIYYALSLLACKSHLPDCSGSSFGVRLYLVLHLYILLCLMLLWNVFTRFLEMNISFFIA